MLRPVSYSRFLSVALATAGFVALAGCASSSVHEINKAAVASRVSYTDEASRLLARKTPLLIKDRTADYRVGRPRTLLIC